MDDFSSFIMYLFFYFFVMVGGCGGIGDINEALEIIKPKMRKVKLPEKLKDHIPQWGPRRDVPSREVGSNKSEVYILTVILTICHYIYYILCFIGIIVVYILAPSYLFEWGALPFVCSFVVLIGIYSVVAFQRNKIVTKNPGGLDRDFTIENKDNNDKKDIKEDENDK